MPPGVGMERGAWDGSSCDFMVVSVGSILGLTGVNPTLLYAGTCRVETVEIAPSLNCNKR